jgi:predicted amidophosphoribosyltransferase
VPLASIKKLRKIDEATRGIHYHIREEDHCYYLVERTSKVGYSFSKANQLIVNLKKRPNSSAAELNYKARAIASCARKLSEILKDKIKETATFVPVPPSKAVDHPEYDNRMELVCQGIAPNLDVRNLVVQSTSMQASHERDENDRITLQELLDDYSIDEELANPAPSVIVVVDDVLTAGTHFRAMESVLGARFPDALIVGILIARRVYPDEEEIDIF